MTILKIEPNENGSHENQTMFGVTLEDFPLPEGYAIVPEEVGTPETLENYPFGDITVEDREGVPTVTSWTPLPIPEPEVPPGVTADGTYTLDKARAQIDYLSMMTGVELPEEEGDENV